MPIYLQERGLDRPGPAALHFASLQAVNVRRKELDGAPRKPQGGNRRGDGGRPQGRRTAPGIVGRPQGRKGSPLRTPSPPGPRVLEPEPPGAEVPWSSRCWRAARRRPGGTAEASRRKAEERRWRGWRAARRTTAIRPVTSEPLRLLGAPRARGADGGWGLRFSASRRSLGFFYLRTLACGTVPV
jgi:hypothetical protein